jgi:hypothetical protein
MVWADKDLITLSEKLTILFKTIKKLREDYFKFLITEFPQAGTSLSISGRNLENTFKYYTKKTIYENTLNFSESYENNDNNTNNNFDFDDLRIKVIIPQNFIKQEYFLFFIEINGKDESGQTIKRINISNEHITVDRLVDMDNEIFQKYLNNITFDTFVNWAEHIKEDDKLWEEYEKLEERIYISIFGYIPDYPKRITGHFLSEIKRLKSSILSSQKLQRVYGNNNNSTYLFQQLNILFNDLENFISNQFFYLARNPILFHLYGLLPIYIRCVKNLNNNSQKFELPYLDKIKDICKEIFTMDKELLPRGEIPNGELLIEKFSKMDYIPNSFLNLARIVILFKDITIG